MFLREDLFEEKVLPEPLLKTFLYWEGDFCLCGL